MVMAKIRDDADLVAWQQGNIQLVATKEGVFLITAEGEDRLNFRVTGESAELGVGEPVTLAAALIELTGEDPAGVLARFTPFTTAE